MATTQAIHVQVAIAEGRHAGQEGSQNSAGAATARAMSGTFEGNSVQRRTDALIDKLIPTTDHNLYVLPAVLSARDQAYEAVLPAHAMQSGLLAYEIMPQNSLPGSFVLSTDTTGGDAKLAAATASSPDTTTPQADAQANEDDMPWARKQALHLMAAREAAKLDEASRTHLPTRGQFGFSKQLQMSAAKRQATASKT